MTLQIPRWRREPGEALVIVPPDGRGYGHIVIREGVRPLTSLAGAPAVALAELVGDALRITTHEGEVAALTDDDTGTRAIIWGDDAQTELTGVASEPAGRAAIAAVVREIVLLLPLGLGLERARRFWYTPPPGWRGIARGLDAEWISADGAATIQVRRARPLRWSVPATRIEQFLHDEQFFEFVLDEPIMQDSFTVGALRGKRGRAVGKVHGRPRTFITIAVEDDQTVYTARLKCDGELSAHEAIFDALVQSIEPLPKAQPRSGASAVLAHWTD